MLLRLCRSNKIKDLISGSGRARFEVRETRRRVWYNNKIKNLISGSGLARADFFLFTFDPGGY